MAGLYIHIPFCASRCIYCGFYSTTSLQMQDRYVDAVCKEMEIKNIPSTLSSIYIGGGTPSQLSEKNLRKIFLHINKVYGEGCLTDDNGMPIEITMECNPDDITSEFCKVLQSLPINRISMGAQTFSDERLKFLRRRHNAEEVRTAVTRLRAIGIKNISVDLMFGFPNETLEEWENDINECLALDVEHISAYSLMYEESTPLHRMLSEKKVYEIDEELSLKMYDILVDRLEAADYEHYEISNFARRLPAGSPYPSMRSRHNSSYWHGIPYIGLGAAAHSFDIKSRQWNVSDIKTYITSVERGEIPCEREFLDTDIRYNDTVMTALRTCEGIDLNNISGTFGSKYENHLLRNARKNIELGNLVVTDGFLRLTRKGIYISDTIMSDMMIVN